jgi:hypothetical protein
VVDSKFGCLRGGWCSHVPTGAFGVGLWKNIRKGWETFLGYIRFKVGDGTMISFWHDLWVGNMTLKATFSALFGIAAAKDASVANNLEFLGGSNQWNVSFAREAHDWEVDVFASFFQILDSVIVRRGGEEKLWLEGTRPIGTGFPWKCVWRTQAPSRAAFFSWSVALGKILTLDNLRKRHVIVINRCFMCKKTEESVDHLLFHCNVAFALWYSLFSRFGLSWAMLLWVIDLLACWWSLGRSRSATVWKMAPTCVFWCLWRERNNRSFEDV